MTATSPPLALYLVRHGETRWSISGQHTGSTDIPLTAHGEDEARALKPWLADIEFAAVFTSLQQRARHTCELVGLGDSAAIDPDLAEWDYGDFEGMATTEIHETLPHWNVFRDGCPNGETPADVTDRADRLIARLGAMSGNVALFSHGQFGPALAARWIGLDVVEAQHLRLGTASLSILGSNPAHPDIRVISLWNGNVALFTRGLKAPPA